MKVFIQKMVELFAHDLPFNKESIIPIYMKLDSVCRFTAHFLQATSVSIILYNGKDDCLHCRGRYINSRYSHSSVDEFQKITERICVYSYIDSIRKPAIRVDPNVIYEEFKNSVLKDGDISKKEFITIFERYPNWKESYKKYWKTVKSELYRIDNKSNAGEIYKIFLGRTPEYETSISFDSIEKLKSDDKYYFFEKLKKELFLEINAKYYVELPLFANGDYFGILRFLFPKETHVVKKNENNNLDIDEDNKKLIESIAQIISLHLENNYIIDSYSKTYFTALKHISEFSSLKEFLKDQCNKLSLIIESKGVIIRLLNKKGKSEIAGFSEGLQGYYNSVEKEKIEYFEEITKRLQRTQNLIGIHFSIQAPFDVIQYIVHEKKEYLTRKFEEWPLSDLKKSSVLDKLRDIGIFYIGILPIPKIENGFIVILNSKNRNFFSKDFEMIYPAVKNLSYELESFFYTKQIENRMNVISKMHEEIFDAISDEKLEGNKYVREFLEILGKTIKKLGIFTHHIAWEYVSEEVPKELGRADKTFFRNITHANYNESLLNDMPGFSWCKNKIYPIEDGSKNLIFDSRKYFELKNLIKIFKLNLANGYSYFDLPFYNYNVHKDEKPRIIGVFSLVFKKEHQRMIKDTDFFNFMQFFSKQISIAWQNLLDKITDKIQKKIDQHMRTSREVGFSSKSSVLNKLSEILAEYFSSDICCFFLYNEKENCLELAASNIPIKQKIIYSTENDKNTLSVRSFLDNKNLRIFGRERVEKLVNIDKLKHIESEISTAMLEIFRRRFLERNEKFEYDKICIEHWHSQVITIGGQKLGLIKLFLAKGISDRDKDRIYDYTRHPFSEFETTLLERVQKHIFNVLITYKTIQQRINDMQNVIHQVIAPLNAIISQCTNLERGIVPLEKINEKYTYLKIQSRLAARYARNFQKILDIDTGAIKLNKDRIPLLRKYLIDKAIDFQSIAKEKGINIHVIGEGRENISLEVDIDLFDQVVGILLDNAVKYSFSPDDRFENGMKRTLNPDDDGNIVLSAREKDDAIFINVSNWGVEIPIEEREKIFEREYRGKNVRDIVPIGNGIGLYLAREIVKMHRGTLDLNPDTKRFNTIFKIKFPQEVKYV